MAHVAFTDATGAATLSNGRPAPADRFADWQPLWQQIGPRRVAGATGDTYGFPLRTDHGARFRIPDLPAASLDVAVRLKAYLEGTDAPRVSVVTGDAAARTYSTCTLWPGSTVEISLADPAEQLYDVVLSVLDRQSSPGVMRCVY
jgi:hypothetical protein